MLAMRSLIGTWVETEMPVQQHAARHWNGQQWRQPID